MTYRIFSKPGCKYCTLAKNLLEKRGLDYQESIIGEDLTREEFLEAYPHVRTVPFILQLDGPPHSVIGGYEDLVGILGEVV